MGAEHIIAHIALNITKTTLVDFKALTVCAGIPDTHKWYPQVGLVQVSCPCHVGRHPMLCIMLQGPGVGVRRMDIVDQLIEVEDLKTV